MRIPLLYTVSAVLFLSALPPLAQAEDTATAAPAVAVAPLPAPDPLPAPPPVKDAVFTLEQLDQMLAPIALYPDPLLAQVLMASTYPGEIAEAVTWSKAHPDAKGDDAVKQVATQPWDPAVQSLVAFPQVLATMGQDPVWVQRLGDAFLAQPDDVMKGVQRLRHKAQEAGNLQSNEYQNVTAQPAAASAPSSSTVIVQSAPAAPPAIIIQPADPQVVYVPSYNPTVVYGTWPYPASPPVYYPPPPAYYPGQALMTGLAFGVGVAAVGALWANSDWGNNDIDVDVNRSNNISGNNFNSNNTNNRAANAQNTKWQHNSAHRDGVPYRDNRSREQYGRQLDGASQRSAYRGDNAQRAQDREKARGSMDRAGIERPATSNRQAQDRARAAQNGGSAGNRTQANNNRPKTTDRGQGTAKNTRDNQPARKQTAQTNQRGQGDAKARQTAQNRPSAGAGQNAQKRPSTGASQTAPKRSTASAGSARNNAFSGARSPSQTSAQTDRGRSSQASAQRPSASRSAGSQVSRPSSPPARSRGGRR
ncbi:DUF3300 domain-containing protein [Pseudomonas sp. NA-150]|uniref:DUF3300 domain-containing protein n=1 Tax=Pseudomonas sp. NA-150 TaxID=3367525 RepID=UPI0037C6E0DB